jgi:hypothetical protein
MARRIAPNRAAATYPLPVVAFLLGIGRNSAYDAAADEVFPTIRVRGRIVAIAGPINRMLELTGPDDPRVQEAYRLAGLVPAIGHNGGPPLDDSETHAAELADAGRVHARAVR